MCPAGGSPDPREAVLGGADAVLQKKTGVQEATPCSPRWAVAASGS